MAAPTTSKIKRTIAQKEIFEDLQGKIAATASWETGALLVWDATNAVVKVPAAETEGNTFLGITDNTVVSGVLKQSYIGTDNSASIPSYEIAGPSYGVVAQVVLKTGDSLAIGASVYLDPASGQNNVQASGTKAIGCYVGNVAISSAAAGTTIQVLLGARFPNDVLKF